MKPTTSDLSDLMARVAAQDRDAFAALYTATSAKLYGIVLRILQRREVADEILQEVYVRIWQRAGEFDRMRASPITWMATIARNLALDEVRRKRPLAIEETPEALAVADPARSASDMVEISEDWRRLEKCLGELDVHRQAIVRLAYLDGWSRDELAQKFGHPVATIKTWLHRSLKQLKDCLGT